MIAILDIGKTNKKCFVFDEDYRIVYEHSDTLPETQDEDGEPCESLEALTAWVRQSIATVLADPRFDIKAVNISAYGASLVHLDADKQPVTPLYNYLKWWPDALKKHFLAAHGPAADISLETASPLLGNLNSGLQLYQIKYQKPGFLPKIKTSLHLPQYIAFLLHGQLQGEITSLGCHTMLWDFNRQQYHNWVEKEGFLPLMAPLTNATEVTHATLAPGRTVAIGTGLHDSSAALIPYLASTEEPFLLLSTGTWCISLNPFNQEPLTAAELAQDTLCYMSYTGRPVKAARYFGGNEFEHGCGVLAENFGVKPDFYKKTLDPSTYLGQGYAQLMDRILEKQVASLRLALGNSPVRRIFVDGGFTQNTDYMSGLAKAFPDMEVYAAQVPQATAIGAACAVHTAWNTRPFPAQLVDLKRVAL